MKPAYGIDVGGTFTDFVSARGEVIKLSSNHQQPGLVFEEGLRALVAATKKAPQGDLIHGTTVATNALLTGSGLARTGVLTTAGFEDLLALGRQNRPQIFALNPQPEYAAPRREFCHGIRERVDAQGRILEALNEDDVERALLRLKKQGVQALAICFLHSYRNPKHEQRVRRLAQKMGFAATSSAELIAVFREFERFSTAFANAALMPILEAYCADLKSRQKSFRQILGQELLPRIAVMQSDGGNCGLGRAAAEPSRLVLSGPAGGLVGAVDATRSQTRERILTLDMGGTSSDVALIAEELPWTQGCVLAGREISLPAMDIHTIGAGGGSIAFIDRAGSLQVGPQSAGANPGPACYGKGGPATVTDANLYLGRIQADHFLGGTFALDNEATTKVIEALAQQIKLEPLELALGILRIAEARMARALRAISLERGEDPREFSLVCYGGAGALQGAALMAELEMKELVVPPNPGLLSAGGMLGSAMKRELTQTVLGSTWSLAKVIEDPTRAFAAIQKRMARDLSKDGFDLSEDGGDKLKATRILDLRYAGQSYELKIVLKSKETLRTLTRRFEAEHERRFGFLMPHADLELTSISLRMEGTRKKRRGRKPPAKSRLRAIAKEAIGFAGGREMTPIYRRENLSAATRIQGPALIVEYSTATLVPPGFVLTLDELSCLVIRRQL